LLVKKSEADSYTKPRKYSMSAYETNFKPHTKFGSELAKTANDIVSLIFQPNIVA